MLSFINNKYLINSIITIVLFGFETKAQFGLNILSFNGNRAGNNSLNNNGNFAFPFERATAAPAQNSGPSMLANSLISLFNRTVPAGIIYPYYYPYPYSYPYYFPPPYPAYYRAPQYQQHNYVSYYYPAYYSYRG